VTTFADKVDMALVDIDELPELAMNHNVGAVPSVLAMKDGKVVDKFVGLKDDDQIDKFISGVAK
jgi:thioredoxin 1